MMREEGYTDGVVPSFGRRWVMVCWIFSGIAVAYTLRVNLSVAVNDMGDEFGWSVNQEGLVLSSFFWGYAVGQIPGGRLAHRYGAKRVFAFSILVPSLLTIIFPLICETSFVLALVFRAITGLCAAATFPSTYNFFYKWVPFKEKTKMVPIAISGTFLGTKISTFPVLISI